MSYPKTTVGIFEDEDIMMQDPPSFKQDTGNDKGEWQKNNSNVDLYLETQREEEYFSNLEDENKKPNPLEMDMIGITENTPEITKKVSPEKKNKAMVLDNVKENDLVNSMDKVINSIKMKKLREESEEEEDDGFSGFLGGYMNKRSPDKSSVTHSEVSHSNSEIGVFKEDL